MELTEIRDRLDTIDAQLLDLFCERMKLAAEVAASKKKSGKAVFDPAREREKLSRVADQVPEERFHGFDIRRAHPRPQERTVKYTFVLPLFHHLSSPTYVFRILLPTPQALMNLMRISARKDRLSPKRIFVKVSQVLISL